VQPPPTAAGDIAAVIEEGSGANEPSPEAMEEPSYLRLMNDELRGISVKLSEYDGLLARATRIRSAIAALNGAGAAPATVMGPHGLPKPKIRKPTQPRENGAIGYKPSPTEAVTDETLAKVHTALVSAAQPHGLSEPEVRAAFGGEFRLTNCLNALKEAGKARKVGERKATRWFAC